MGRETRQARRARERRDIQRGKTPSTRRGGRGKGPNWTMIGGVAVIVACLAAVGAMIAFGGGKALSGPAPTPTEVPGKPVAGLQCDPTEQVTYHVHGHLTILDKGKSVTVPAGIGINYNHDCLYWVHTHNPDGVIHVESPYKITPTLASFFKLWGQPLTATQIGPAKVQPGETVKTYVNQKLWTGNPAAIKVRRHTTITIEIGPPFVPPKPYAYGEL